MAVREDDGLHDAHASIHLKAKGEQEQPRGEGSEEERRRVSDAGRVGRTRGRVVVSRPHKPVLFREDLVSNKRLSTVCMLAALQVIYQPGIQGEKTTLLKALERATLFKLYDGRFVGRRALEIHAIQPGVRAQAAQYE